MEPVVIATKYNPEWDYERMWIVRVGRERSDTVCLVQRDIRNGEFILKSGDEFDFEAAKRAVLDLQSTTFSCEVVPGLHAPYTYSYLEAILGEEFRLAFACHVLMQRQYDLVRKEWNLKDLREKIRMIKEHLREENYL